MKYTLQNGIWAPERKGLGDSIAAFTKMLGFKECGGCNRRRAWLNRAVPYKRRWPGHPIAGGAADLGLEARGFEIEQQGGSVICAERLNVSGFSIINNTWMDPLDFNIRPCHEVSADLGTTMFPTNWVQVPGAGVGFPAQSWVWATQGGEVKLTPTSANFKRLSMRYYTTLADNYSFGSCGSTKWMQMSDSLGVVEFQGAGFIGPTSPVVRVQRTTVFPQSTNLFFSHNGGFTWNDCRISGGGPCRVEVSWSCTGTCPSMTGMSVEALVVPLGFQASQPNRRAVLAPTFAGDADHAISTIVGEGPNAFSQFANCGLRYFSHTMWAGWPVDAGQLIGPAVEIEGAAPLPPPPAIFSIGGGIATAPDQILGI